jgi:hypothetical protein
MDGIKVRWRGLVLNAEYLGLDVSLRGWLSNFWGSNIDPLRFSKDAGPPVCYANLGAICICQGVILLSL